MSMIKDIECALPLVAALPAEWQKDVAVVLSRFVLAYDKTLTMTPVEARLERDHEIAAALELALRGSGMLLVSASSLPPKERQRKYRRLP